jgi:hypothetical protein
VTGDVWQLVIEIHLFNAVFADAGCDYMAKTKKAMPFKGFIRVVVKMGNTNMKSRCVMNVAKMGVHII